MDTYILFRSIPRRTIVIFGSFGVLFLVFVNIVVWFFLAENRQKILTVSFLDIGQGDAIYIQAPNGNQILMDGGSGREILSALGQVMPIGDRSLDIVIGTHPDKDHIGGLVPVIENYRVTHFMEPGIRSDTAIDRALVQLVEEKKIPYTVLHRGMRIVLDASNGIFLDIFHPTPEFYSSERNDYSVVARLVFGETSFLFTGDASTKVETILANKDGAYLRSDVLKAGHHGSRTSTGENFINAVTPEVVVASYGCDNSYGHPHAQVVDSLKVHKISFLGTCENKTITFTSDGTSIKNSEI